MADIVSERPVKYINLVQKNNCSHTAGLQIIPAKPGGGPEVGRRSVSN